jgi:hypothetical protein
MNLKEKTKIYRDIWCSAHRRRHDAKVAGDWNRYEREHQTVLMCLRIAKWWRFDSEGEKYL